MTAILSPAPFGTAQPALDGPHLLLAFALVLVALLVGWVALAVRRAVVREGYVFPDDEDGAAPWSSS